MAGIGEVKLWFMEQVNPAGFVSYGDPDVIPDNYKLAKINDVWAETKRITVCDPSDGDMVSIPHGLYPDTLITPAPMILNIDNNNPGAPGSRAARVIDEYTLEIKGDFTGFAIGQLIMVFSWVEWSAYLKVGSLYVSRQDDHNDSASFTILTTPDGFMPYAGMNVLIKYGSGFTLFGGVVKESNATIGGRYKGLDSAIEIRVDCDTFSVLAKRQVFWNGAPKLGKTAKWLIENWLLPYLQIEGVTVGLIEDGEYFEKFPSKSNGVFKLSSLLDDLADQSGYRWYINPDKALFFVPAEASYNPTAQEWEPDITDAPFDLVDEGEFEDYREFSLSTNIELLSNAAYLEGGVDINKVEALAIGRDDAQILLTQLRFGGSGVWAEKIEDDSVKLIVQKAVENIASDVITITGHELTVGDFVVNVSNYYRQSRVSQVVNANQFKIMGGAVSVGLVVGSVMGWYPQANTMIRTKLSKYGLALPKIIEFESWTIGNETKIWAPGQRLEIGLAGFGPAGSGVYLTKAVSYADAGGTVRVSVTAELYGG